MAKLRPAPISKLHPIYQSEDPADRVEDESDPGLDRASAVVALARKASGDLPEEGEAVRNSMPHAKLKGGR